MTDEIATNEGKKDDGNIAVEKRIRLIIHKEFGKCQLPMEYNNYLCALRNRMCEIVQLLLAELKIKKKFGVDVDMLDEDIERIDLCNGDNPYWLKGSISHPRPPGPTNKEISDLLTTIKKIIMKMDDEVLNMLRMKMSVNDAHTTSTLLGYESKIISEIKNTFTIPNQDLPFTSDMYDRNMHFPFNKTQNTPCEICGENRATDLCHILPASLGGSAEPHNTIYLCPIHHRLFDRLMLSKEEWEKIDWGKQGKVASNYAYHILLPEMKKFWDKMAANDFKKNTVNWGATGHYQNSDQFDRILIIAMNDKVEMSREEIIKSVNINPHVVPIRIRELRKQGRVVARRKKKQVVYSVVPSALDDIIISVLKRKREMTSEEIIECLNINPNVIPNRISELVKNGIIVALTKNQKTIYTISTK